MSRSFKKTPILKTGGYKKAGKRMANRKVRHSKQGFPPKSKKYKKLFEQWDIHDYAFWGESLPERKSEDCEDRNWWKKHYFRK